MGKHNSEEILCHFVVIGEKFKMLMRGYCVFENRRSDVQSSSLGVL